MIHRPPGMGAFQFVTLATLRSAQLIRGCRPRVDGGHKLTVTAQVEVAEGKVLQMVAPAAAPAEEPVAPAPFADDLVTSGVSG